MEWMQKSTASDFCALDFTVLRVSKIVLDRVITFSMSHPAEWAKFIAPVGYPLHECIELDDVEEWLLNSTGMQVSDFLMNVHSKTNMTKVAYELAAWVLKHHKDADYIEGLLEFYKPGFLQVGPSQQLNEHLASL